MSTEGMTIQEVQDLFANDLGIYWSASDADEDPSTARGMP